MPTENFERLDTSRIARILAVGLDEFAHHRYQDASFNRVIRSCGMAKGTMYYYFASKEDLFLTLYKATVREFNPLVRLAQQPLLDAAAFWPMVTQLLEGLLSILRQKPQAALFVINFLQPSASREAHPAAHAIRAIEQWLLLLILKGQALGALRQDLTAEQLSALVAGIWESLRPWMPGAGGAESKHIDVPKIVALYQSLLSTPDAAHPQLGHRDAMGIDLRPGASGL